MPFDWGNAVVAGLWATLAMTAFLMGLLRLRWLRLDFGALLGHILLPPGRGATAAGMTLHFLSGVLFALGYGLVFWGMQVRPHWWNPLLGTALGVFHWFVSMPLLHVAGHLNRQVRQGNEPDPGTWAINYGPQEAIARLVAHLIFGTVVAGLYFLPGTAMTWSWAVLAAVVMIGLYAWWNPWQFLSRAIPPGQVWIAFGPEEREAARRELRDRLERGEIDCDTYQRERRRLGAEP